MPHLLPPPSHRGRLLLLGAVVCKHTLLAAANADFFWEQSDAMQSIYDRVWEYLEVRGVGVGRRLVEGGGALVAGRRAVWQAGRSARWGPQGCRHGAIAVLVRGEAHPHPPVALPMAITLQESKPGLAAPTPNPHALLQLDDRIQVISTPTHTPFLVSLPCPACSWTTASR